MHSLKKRFQSSRFYLGERARPGPVVLNHRRIFILPTARGFGFVFLIILLFFIAFVYGNNLVYLLTFLLASIFFITILHSYNALAGLILKEGYCRAVFAGEAAGFVIHITNPARSSRPALTITKQKFQKLTIAAQTTIPATVYSFTQKRGWHEAGTITISSTFPLGLFRAWSPIRFSLKALVYPKPSSRDIPFPQPNAAGGGKSNFGNKGSDDFQGLQEYRSGDSIKKIHWKAYAKGQGLFSKQYAGNSSFEIWLAYDNTPGQHVEERLSQLCRWVIDAEKCGIRYGFSLPGIKLAPDSGTAHAVRCLEALALYQQ
ncbi:MAG: DUF58 domain-containing protein [Gammaproteobacteria bacterium]